MNLDFFTDPHLGLDRSSHTTSTSKQRLKDALFSTAEECAIPKDETHVTFCLGDLFDRYTNEERVISQGVVVVENCTATLGGNHDSRNQIGSVSSLALIASLLKNKVIIASYGDPTFSTVESDGVKLSFVPHANGQDTFERSIAEALYNAKQESDITHFLCLHCNYDRDFGHDIDNDPALNLSAARAKELLEVFDYILIGHEHEPLTDHDGRVMVLGNTMPLGFGEIADRFMYTYNTTRKQWSFECIWSMTEEYLELSVEQLLAMDLSNDLSVTQSYVKITGVVEPSQYPDVSKALAHFWKANPELLMVKPDIEINKPTEKQTGQPNFVRASIPQMIAADLEGSELATAYAECVQEEETE